MKATLILMSLGLVLLVAAVGTVAVVMVLSARSDSSAIAQAWKEEEEDVPFLEENKETGKDGVRTVEAGDLLRDYANNPPAADQNYKGKTLLVRAQIDQVYDGSLQVQPGMPVGVVLLCNFRKEERPKLTGVHRGDVVLLSGVCTGRAGGHVDLMETRIVQLEGRRGR
jgi:hypothetical protein